MLGVQGISGRDNFFDLGGHSLLAVQLSALIEERLGPVLPLQVIFAEPTIYRMAEAVKMNMDEPQWVAQRIIEAIEHDASERYLGFPESLFTRINALLPRVVDGALRKQNLQMQPFARREN